MHSQLSISPGLQIAAAGAIAAAVIAAIDSSAAKHHWRSASLAGELLFERIRAYLALTKPVVVLLLLVTTYGGMVVGGETWPEAGLVAWVLTAGAMAAGGSSAINQYIDREIDSKMQRTQRRPIPSGRILPGRALIFGFSLCIASIFISWTFVSGLVALLILAGILYYVVIYSLLLKNFTVQNIVIGGGAGAIPPLVGWAATTGSLNMQAFLLFALIFLWTPPHFWALALVRTRDYARAGVPMLPVVHGAQDTRRKIFIYSVQLVALSLLFPILGLGGALYWVFAVILGLWLLTSAWKVFRGVGNRTAWLMYRHSSVYLGLLFFVLMIDARM